MYCAKISKFHLQAKLFPHIYIKGCALPSSLPLFSPRRTRWRHPVQPCAMPDAALCDARCGGACSTVQPRAFFVQPGLNGQRMPLRCPTHAAASTVQPRLDEKRGGLRWPMWRLALADVAACPGGTGTFSWRNLRPAPCPAPVRSPAGLAVPARGQILPPGSSRAVPGLPSRVPGTRKVCLVVPRMGEN